MSQVPYPGFPPYPPGHPGNAEWERRVREYNARVQEANAAFIVKAKLVFLAATLWTILLYMVLYA